MEQTKIVIICEHLSTGGMPQYVLKKVQLLKDDFNIYVIEVKNFSNQNTVQRNQLEDLLGDRLIKLYLNNKSLLETISEINPEYIWFEEIAEYFLEDEILNEIWLNKSFEIIETSHTSKDLSSSINYIPDRFILVSPYQKQFYEKFNIPISIIDYPVEVKERNKKEKQKELKLDTNKFHIFQIGLFAPHKNQSYTFELATKLKDYPIQFHFIGNMSENFREYFEPLLKNQPKNCLIYGEVSNVEDYIRAADLIIHPSTEELNPLVIKEALEYEDLHILISNIETHKGLYALHNKVEFLSSNLNEDILKIWNKLIFSKIQILFPVNKFN